MIRAQAGSGDMVLNGLDVDSLVCLVRPGPVQFWHLPASCVVKRHELPFLIEDRAAGAARIRRRPVVEERQLEVDEQAVLEGQRERCSQWIADGV